MPEPRTVLILDYNVTATMLSGHSLLCLLDHLDRSRYVPVVVFNRPAEVERAVSARGVEAVVVPHGGGSWLRRGWEYGRLPFALGSIARRTKPSLVHANNAMAARAAIALKTVTGLPVLVHIRNIGLHPRVAPFVLRADSFAPVSQATLEGTLPPRLHPRATVVADGLDLSEYPACDASARADARRALGLPVEALIVGMAGRLSAQKGQRYFVEAAGSLLASRADVVFVHAGKVPCADSSDAYERELASSTAAWSASGRFRWLEYVDSIPRFWAAVDVAAAPSCGPDAFPRVVIEAMAARRPVVATPAGGPQEIITTPDVGALVPMGDGRALAAAIESLLDDPVRRERMGDAARRRVESSYSAGAYALKVMDLYDRLVSRGAS